MSDDISFRYCIITSKNCEKTIACSACLVALEHFGVIRDE